MAYEVDVMDSADRRQYKLLQNVIMEIEKMYSGLDANRAAACLKSVREEADELLEYLRDDQVPIHKIEAAKRDPA